MLDQAGQLTSKRITMAMGKNVSNTEKAQSFCTKQKKKKTSQFRFGKHSLFSQLKWYNLDSIFLTTQG